MDNALGRRADVAQRVQSFTARVKGKGRHSQQEQAERQELMVEAEGAENRIAVVRIDCGMSENAEN